jgi:hypothetical protein
MTTTHAPVFTYNYDAFSRYIHIIKRGFFADYDIKKGIDTIFQHESKDYRKKLYKELTLWIEAADEIKFADIKCLHQKRNYEGILNGLWRLGQETIRVVKNLYPHKWEEMLGFFTEQLDKVQTQVDNGVINEDSFLKLCATIKEERESFIYTSESCSCRTIANIQGDFIYIVALPCGWSEETKVVKISLANL